MVVSEATFMFIVSIFNVVAIAAVVIFTVAPEMTHSLNVAAYNCYANCCKCCCKR